jgi:glycosyltransferase involved in cell wall biosynthesis
VSARGGVSVALATFNGASHLPEQLHSLAAQTRLPRELIACDDGSSDETVQILEQFAREASFPVQIVRNERRLGYADNFLAAAALCTGDLVAFCDQDDVWLATKLAACEAELGRTSAAIVAHSAALADERLRPTGRLVPHARRRRLLAPDQCDPWWYWWGFAMVFERRLLDIADPTKRVESQFLHLPPGSPLDHDDWIAFLGCALGPIAFLPEALVLYRRHPSTASRTPSQMSRIQASRGQDGEWHRAHYANLARLAHERTHFWRRTALERTGREQHLALCAADRFDRFAVAYERRQTLYATGRRAIRARGIAAMLFSGAYRRRANGGLGVGALAKDAYFAMRPARG